MALGTGKLRAATNRVRCVPPTHQEATHPIPPASIEKLSSPRKGIGCPLSSCPFFVYLLRKFYFIQFLLSPNPNPTLLPPNSTSTSATRLPFPRSLPVTRAQTLHATLERTNRTSLANQTNEIWTDLIGIQQSKDAGTNSAIEASLSAPGKIGGQGVGVGKRVKGGVAGDEAIIHPTEALVALARLQGAGAPDTVVEGDRGVCRVCGGMGHLTSMCKNKYSLLKDEGTDGVTGGGVGGRAFWKSSTGATHHPLPVFFSFARVS